MTHANKHPGEILKEEFLWPFGISAKALADALDIPSTLIADIVEERKPMTEDTALRLSEHFGSSAVFWLGLQADYDASRPSD
jgi:addiction module HigA family antidote